LGCRVRQHCLTLALLTRGSAAFPTACCRRSCRPTLDERQKLAAAVHAWRVQYNADNMLQQQPPHFLWFRQHLGLKLLTITPQGHVVVLIKVSVM